MTESSSPTFAHITVKHADKIGRSDDQHQYHRRFIGPMPEKALSQADAIPSRSKQQHRTGSSDVTSTDNNEGDGNRSGIIGNMALRFFLGHGGKREDWGEDQERSVREAMFRRWKESEWGQAYEQRKEARLVQRWIGTSFDVGVFLGVNLLDEGSCKPNPWRPTAETSSSRYVSTSADAETFATAPSHLSPLSTPHDKPWTASQDQIVNGPLSQTGAIDDESLSATSSTALIPPIVSPQDAYPSQVHSEIIHSPKSRSSGPPALNELHFKEATKSIASPNKGKAKMVHYPVTVAEDVPAPPREVLARSGSAVHDSSAEAAQQATAENQVVWGDVVMRDRMLVKVSYAATETVPAGFDEWRNRTMSHLESWNWEEYIVAWRKDRLELYQNHSTPGKDWFAGHKKLVYVIPLASSMTRLSLYSFADLTFCLICSPAPVRRRAKRHWLSGRRKGLNIFVFKVRSRTRAIDWVWHLWRHLGGQLPPFLEIRTPALDTRLRIDIPSHDGADIAAAYAVFNTRNLTRLCQERLRTVREYEAVIERKIAEGAQLELAWRFETNLDWVWQLEDVQGKPRDWAVLCGLTLNQAGKPSQLELRLKEHLPTRLHLKDGTRLDEPPAVEGYLDRIRPNSQLKQAVYLTTHNGYLFALAPVQANHPPPPGFIPPGQDPTDTSSFREAEVRRGTKQILHATGISDLRNIVAVRRAFQLIHLHAEEPPSLNTPDWEDKASFWEHVERTESDDEDAGGDEGLTHAHNKFRLRMRRSFELLLTTGNVVRFEAHSCQTALEWIVRLRPLISYWKKRHQADALQEMDLAHASTGRLRITPQKHLDESLDVAPEPMPDPQAPLPELGSLFNWCVLDVCRSILKAGKIFGREGLLGPYRHLQLVLVSGKLVQFRITSGKSLHHRRHKIISLLDAYVCSGYFAAQYLPEGQYDPDAPPVARRYQDGLESDDHEEDTLFMIWYQPKSDWGEMQFPSRPSAPLYDIPPLSAKRKLDVFRTRSRLERDVWVWAINSEIEKVIRANQDRENKIREAGDLVKT
ncbi:hypothetical protein AcV7_009650 [Taiwanofungus camphoratus]|nr:hypothetical protein AcV7_009650 [Antrodia cinnamomea]